MVSASWTIALGLALAAQAGPTGRWLGQDGHDLTSPSPQLKPNGYQDIHIVLNGLPAGREVQKIVIRPLGAGEWIYNGPPGSWPAALIRTRGSRTADLYLETDRVENGRPFDLKIFYDDGGSVDVRVKGGKSDPGKRMPGLGPAAKWAGQEKRDLATLGPAVGPDGLQDVRIVVSRIPAELEIQGALLEASGGARWHAGLNPSAEWSAELVRDPKDRTRADLFFQPDRDLAGRSLTLTLRYANDKSDVATLRGERTDPKLPMPRIPVPSLAAGTFEARWLGQDGQAEGRPGDVHVSLAKVPANRVLAAAVLSDSVSGLWVHRTSPKVSLDLGPGERPLNFRRGRDRAQADLFFTPDRDETGASMTLRLLFQDGESAVTQFHGGACDPARGQPGPAATSIVARPGDDLNALVGRYGTVTLAGGTHRLAHPLVLEKPVTLRGERGAILEFAQDPKDPPWTAAIKVHAGRTTLRDFAVRFAGPVRWDSKVNYGPAVIGMTDNLDPPHPEPKLGLEFSGLDLTVPPVVKTKDWEESLRLMRLIRAQTGQVSKCTLRGGMVEFEGGPWQLVDNEYRGAEPGTFNWCVFGGHNLHDLVVRGNTTKQVEPAGKTWRFLVMTGWGCNLLVEKNTIAGVGPRDDDTIPFMNAPETILTESYRLRFEGKPSALSTDGRVLGVAELQGDAPQVGDVVSVLAGTGAGEWRTIAQPLAPNAFLLTSPLPRGASVVSIGRGFVGTRIEANSIDTRGSRTAVNIILPGNNFGTVVRKNRIQGGGEALRLLAAPTEQPRIWGWSHAPYLGGVVEDNIIEDSYLGGMLGVEHTKFTKSNAGRTYMTITLRNNTIRWTREFLRDRTRRGEKSPPRGLTLGYRPSHDPDEFVVREEGDRLEAPAGAPGQEALKVHAARFNGRPLRDRGYSLPSGTVSSSTSSGRSR
jgi:hypothetical protein